IYLIYMKTKPLIISIIGILMLSFFLLRCKSSKVSVENGEITQFLERFNKHVVSGNRDSLMTCFSSDRRNPGLEKLINILIDKKGTDGTKLEITLNTEGSVLSENGPATTTARVPIMLDYKDLPSQPTKLTLKILKVGDHQYKITEVDGRLFFTQLIAYQNFIKTKTLSDEDIYSPLTLKAFASANQLKTRYDSVVWFSHVKQQTYFYVVNGEWDQYGAQAISEVKPYKMGLLNPDLKEIIPAEYEWIGSIGGVFPDKIEVTKDGKKGFYDLTGNVVLPVVYDNIFAINDDANIAALKQGANFYWLKNDFTISEKVDLKFADILPKIKQAGSFTISNFGTPDNITEFNSRDLHGSIYLPPSYLVDLNIMPKIKSFKNPMRNKVEFYDVTTNYIVKAENLQSDDGNWFQSAFYNIRDYFLGGRAEFYDKKSLVVINKNTSQIFTADIETAYDEGGGAEANLPCDVNAIKALTDSLFEVKAAASVYVDLYDTTRFLAAGTYYHYLKINNSKLVELPNRRTFGFTKYVKMDDSYLEGCYKLMVNRASPYPEEKIVKHISPELLRYMKNEIYADYRYQFKDKRWKNVFAYLTGDYENSYGEKVHINANVDDSLTVIDKFNINFIDQKLKALKPVSLAAK
ncbi:MAG: WG repeat-containing protein, partial [Bacteroidota bacterium]